MLPEQRSPLKLVHQALFLELLQLFVVTIERTGLRRALVYIINKYKYMCIREGTRERERERERVTERDRERQREQGARKSVDESEGGRLFTCFELQKISVFPQAWSLRRRNEISFPTKTIVESR